ncbi:PH domain-containing protein [Bacillus arachidis]|uniref:PH domain-containing protein n=1 Tax=Bacillus arachidis TaxID=2819290 RepID=A0ABS3NYM2_9BACI|nr:PH domain-containing protein [Bacillus arachidis]MBO1626044.1 PH domain-containing protein [Bacillus arachidis]
MYFPSKKDAWIYSIYLAGVAACFAPFLAGGDYFLLFFTIPFAILLIWSWFTTGYTVEDEQIIIRYGLRKKRISIKDIRKISKTKNPLAAPALSFDRLEILYGSQFETELISPRDTQRFIFLIKSIHPQIEVANNVINE